MNPARSSVFVELEVGADDLPLDNEYNRQKIATIEEEHCLVLDET